MKTLLPALILLFHLNATAKVKVVTTLPDIAEVVRVIGGDQVEVQSLLHGNEDPHYADARPDYILKVNRADVVCSIGMDLEVGWLPKVLSKSGNAKVQEGGSGYCVLGNTVKALEIPQGKIDRSWGDVHPQGNPHFNLSPLKMIEASQEVVRVLSMANPQQKGFFEKNYGAFKEKYTQLHSLLSKNLKKTTVMEYHKEFTYFFNAYDLESMGSLEEKPGNPPSAARIAQVALMAKSKKVSVLFATPSAPHKVLEKFTELSGIPVVYAPSYVQDLDKSQTKSIEDLQKLLVKSIP